MSESETRPRALRDPARSGDKRNGLIICAEPGCPGVYDAVYRTNPKGERGVFKCAEHAFSTSRDYRTRYVAEAKAYEAALLEQSAGDDGAERAAALQDHMYQWADVNRA